MKRESGGRRGFFDEHVDASLPSANAAFWAALLRHIERDGIDSPRVLLDVGSHNGALLGLLAERFEPEEIIGIEPVAELRHTAVARLKDVRARCRMLRTEDWPRVEDASVDLIVSHEVLYLVDGLDGLMEELRRVLAPAGTAYLVLGCHTANPVWPSWKGLLLEQGIATFDHSPFEILSAGWSAGLAADVQPLRTSGWIRYNPAEAAFPFPDAGTLFEHHYRNKLIFRMKLDDDDGPATP